MAAPLTLLLACTRFNPAFGDDDAGGSSGGTSLDPSGPSGTATATADGSGSSPTASTSDTTTLDTSDTAVDTGDERRCGDGTKDEDLGEQCDDGDGMNRDDGSCQTDCTLNECGDGFPAPDQPCDEGPRGNHQCTPECTLRSCGDGVVQAPEACEPKLSETCTSLCQENVCGDGEVLGDEQCDDENADDHDACTNACAHAVCGDGIIREGVEQCEANDVPSCEDLEMQGIAFCDPSSCLVVGCGTCGNGRLEPNEFCEVGDILNCVNVGLAGNSEFPCNEDCVPDQPVGCCVPDGLGCALDIPCCGECVDELCVDG